VLVSKKMCKTTKSYKKLAGYQDSSILAKYLPSIAALNQTV